MAFPSSDSPPLRCYTNQSFYQFVKNSFLTFPSPRLSTFLSLMPPDRQTEVSNDMYNPWITFMLSLTLVIIVKSWPLPASRFILLKIWPLPSNRFIRVRICLLQCNAFLLVRICLLALNYPVFPTAADKLHSSPWVWQAAEETNVHR